MKNRIVNFEEVKVYSSNRAMGEIYIGRDVNGSSTANLLRHKEKENRAIAQEKALIMVDEYLKSLDKYGRVVVFEKSNIPAYERYFNIHNTSSVKELAQLLGYKKQVFTQQFIRYNIYTKSGYEEKGTGQFNFVHDYTNRELKSIREETRKVNYTDYFYQEEVCQLRTELYVKVIGSDVLTTIQKENEFIKEHDYYLSRNKQINSNGAKKNILNIFIPFCCFLLLSLMLLISSCFVKGGYYADWNYATIDGFVLSKIKFLQFILGNNTILLMLIFMILEVILLIYTYCAIKGFSKIKTGIKNGDKIGKIIEKIFLIMLLFNVFVTITSLLGLIEKVYYGDAKWTSLREGFSDLGLWLFGIFRFILNYTRILFIIGNICLIGIYIYGAFTNGFGLLNRVTQDIEIYNKKIKEMESNGRFVELEKIKDEILSANVHI